ncbi:MAG TPA: glycosyltransferase [Bacteroidia bacterium]|nr:glycosyltransferase [Bacteroidia bacterium]
MHDILQYFFFGAALLVLHTYFIYPVFMLLFFRKPGFVPESYKVDDDLPSVAVLIAAYNEEKVIGEKLRSVLLSDYPEDKIHIYVGSDASEDQTDKIVQEFVTATPRIHLIQFKGRVGKIEIINNLTEGLEQELLVLTDANVIFRRNTLFELVRQFKDKKIGLVAGNIIKESANNDGISFQEKTYLSFENLIKSAESNAFQLIIGAEGGCFAIRKELYSKVPSHYIVDDFFLTLEVLNKGKLAIFNAAALCSEDVNVDPAGEYRRKVRISSGNFQNLAHFRKNLWPLWNPLPFVFWSHKVLRWLTPFLLIIALISSAFLAASSFWFTLIFLLQFLGFLLPFADRMAEFKNPVLKFISHFYLMNIALLHGFVRFCRGIKSSVWQPVKRNV